MGKGRGRGGKGPIHPAHTSELPTPVGASTSPSTTTQSNSAPQPSFSSRPRKTHGPTRVRVTGARKIWGTVKSTTAAAVANALKTLAKAPQNALSVKRKYKINAKRVTRWWFVIRGEKSLLEQLPSTWHLVNIQTAWKLEPVFKHQKEDSPQPADALPKEPALACDSLRESEATQSHIRQNTPPPSTPSSVNQQHTLNNGLQTRQGSSTHSTVAALVPSDNVSVDQASDKVHLDNSQCLGSHPVTVVSTYDNESNSFLGEN